MTKTEHTALPQQHVVAQADDDRDAHLAEQRLAQAAAENQWRQRQHESVQAPHHSAPHQSPRAPSKPRGRKISTSTSNR